jgi:hypothetical protein
MEGHTMSNGEYEYELADGEFYYTESDNYTPTYPGEYDHVEGYEGDVSYEQYDRDLADKMRELDIKEKEIDSIVDLLDSGNPWSNPVDPDTTNMWDEAGIRWDTTTHQYIFIDN